MNVKYKRYKVKHKGKKYYVFVPEGIKNNLWIVDWGDWWYGTFIRGSRQAMRILTRSFALLGFNPYAVVFFPVRYDMLPEGLDRDPENGGYDIVFRTNRVHFKDKDWKAIRNKLKCSPCTIYEFKYNKERASSYFEKATKDFEYLDYRKILKKSGANAWLGVGTAFFVYPQRFYQRMAVPTIESIESLRGEYYERRDEWIPELDCFCYGGYERPKYTYKEPGIALNLEVFDLREVNRVVKKKVKLVEHRAKRKRQSGVNPG